tara:strand:+ start:170 stop:1264 length:1095 start_codon:yes stop_codon:yes gene_type:complete
MTTYEKSGVNVNKGNEASKIFYEAEKETWKNRQNGLGEIIVPNDDFSGVRAIDVSSLPIGTLMNMGFDGVGTKIEIAERMNRHDTIAFDLFAMVCDDAIVRKAEPIAIGSILDFNKLDINIVKQLAKGYVEAAKEANVVVVNGEIAELGNRVNGFNEHNYNWGSTIIWFVNKNKILTGKEINIDNSIVALEEKGFRSNGFSLLRKILHEKYGENWHEKELDDEKIGNLALIPSKIYSKIAVEMFGGVKDDEKIKINGIVHVTGGGVPEKLERILKISGFGAELDNLFSPCKLMLHCQEIGNVSDKEAYKTWCMGQGLLIITPEPKKVIEYCLENNINAKICGKVTENKAIKIKSKGLNGEELVF